MFSLQSVKRDSFSMLLLKTKASDFLHWLCFDSMLLTCGLHLLHYDLHSLEISTFLNLTHSLVFISIDFTTVHLRRHVCVSHKSFHTRLSPHTRKGKARGPSFKYYTFVYRIFFFYFLGGSRPIINKYTVTYTFFFFFFKTSNLILFLGYVWMSLILLKLKTYY